MIESLDIAYKYSEESIEKCKQLADFLKKRQEIEDEYAKSLRKLCKSVSLKPLKKQGWFSRFTESKTEEKVDEVQTHLLRTHLWSTFYEIVDDTSQIAKSHGILAESIANQILGPFDESIKNMELNRRRVVEESESVSSELNEASSILRKAKQQLEDSTNEVNVTRLALSRTEGGMTVKPRELEKARLKYQSANEKLTIARASYRQCDEVCKSLQNKVNMVDIPRISRILSGLEASRGQETRQILQSVMKLNRQTAEMDIQCSMLMEQKVSEIVLDEVLDALMLSNQDQTQMIDVQHDDNRRYSITKPLVNKLTIISSAYPVNLNDNSCPVTTVPRTETINPSPSYYPNPSFHASINVLEDKKLTGNTSQIIQ